MICRIQVLGSFRAGSVRPPSSLAARFIDEEMMPVGNPVPLVYGSERTDVRDAGACDSADVGFVAIWNWGNLSDGTYTAMAYDNGRGVCPRVRSP